MPNTSSDAPHDAAPHDAALRVAVLGLGLMGSGMAASLLRAGLPTTVYNRTAAKGEALVAQGARLARTPREAAEGAAVIVSMVADDDAARAVWLGDDGALAGADASAVLVESSTITEQWIAELAEAADARGCALLDAPVTGSRTHAAAGELQFLVGGDAATLERARPALDVMSRRVVHVGPRGSGVLLKLVNNFLCGVQAAALAEAVALVERGGLDRDTALGVLADGAPGSPLVKGLIPRMTARDYAPHFHLALMAKDLTYAQGAAARYDTPLTTATAARAAFERAAASGLGERDVSAVVEPLRATRDAT